MARASVQGTLDFCIPVYKRYLEDGTMPRPMYKVLPACYVKKAHASGQAGIAPALWEQSLKLTYRNSDSKVPGTCSCGSQKCLPSLGHY